MRRVLVCLALVACSRKQPAPAPQPEPSSAVSVTPSAPPAAREASYADLSGDVLSQCVDIRSTDPSALERAAGDAKGATKLAKSCAQQFADRVELASCTVTRKDGVYVRAAYYDFASVGEDDVEMSECIKAGGDWKSVSRDSRVWRAAKLEYARRKFEKASKR